MADPKPLRPIKARPDFSDLNEGQWNAAEGMAHYLYYQPEVESDQQDISGTLFLLTGYAGTGKTYVMSKVIEDYLFSTPSAKVCVTAPVNKAVKVCRNAAKYYDERLTYRTVHSLLGLKPQIQQDGTIKYLPEKGQKENPITNLTLLVVDETSMLDDYLFELLVEEANNGLKIIFVGDPFQIPSVNNGDPIIFRPECPHTVWRAQLTECMRTASTSPILELATELREDPLRFQRIAPVDSPAVDGSQVYFLEGTDFRALLKTWFTSPNFDRDSDFAKVIAWKNKTVNSANALIRRLRYGATAQSIMVGEKLLADTPIFQMVEGVERIVFTTNDEFEVLELVEATVTLVGNQYKYYDTKVQGSDGTVEIIRILHEDSHELYGKYLGASWNWRRPKERTAALIGGTTTISKRTLRR